MERIDKRICAGKRCPCPFKAGEETTRCLSCFSETGCDDGPEMRGGTANCSVILSDEPVEGKQHMAYVKEHYNVGTIDASRLLVRPEFVALIRKKESDGDFALLCRLYETAEKFAVYERKEDDIIVDTNRPRTWNEAGEYPVSIVMYKNIWKQQFITW